MTRLAVAALGDQALAVLADAWPMPVSTDQLCAAVGTVARTDPRTGNITARACMPADLYPALRRLRRLQAIEAVRFAHNTVSWWSLTAARTAADR